MFTGFSSLEESELRRVDSELDFAWQVGVVEILVVTTGFGEFGLQQKYIIMD